MASLKSLIFTLFFIQGILSYCIYNKLTDENGIFIVQVYSGARPGKEFYKYIEAGGNSCCPYTEKNFSYNRVNNEEAHYVIVFDGVPLSKDSRRIAKCTTGGALFISGTVNSYHVECVQVNDVSDDALAPIVTKPTE